MIATTIISSIRVKPELSLFTPLSYACLAEASTKVYESDIPQNPLRCAETIYVISRKLNGVGWVNYFQGVYVWK